MKRVIVGLVIFIVIIVLGYVLFFKKPPQQTLSEEKVSLSQEAKDILEEAQILENQDKYKQARKLYAKILEDYPQDADAAASALRKLGELNIKILFSPLPDEFSTFYAVKPGDTLSKIAKEFGTTVELIKKSNGLKSDVIRPGQKLKVCNKRFSVLIDKSQNLLMLKADDRIIKTYTISTGRDNITPVGTFKIVNRIVNPTWFKEGEGEIPAGDPRKVLGRYWLGFNLKGYGIHGTNDESVIGKSITQGCIRMHNKDVEELFIILPLGTEVVIQE